MTSANRGFETAAQGCSGSLVGPGLGAASARVPGAPWSRHGVRGGLCRADSRRATERDDQEPRRRPAEADREGEGRERLGLANADGALAPVGGPQEMGVRRTRVRMVT